MSIYDPNQNCTIGKYIKKKFLPPQNPLIYSCKKVWADENGKAPEWRDPDFWKKGFIRHQENLCSGFFTPVTQGFKPMGGDIVETSVREAEKMRNPNKRKHYRSDYLDDDAKPDPKPPVEEPLPVQIIESIQCVNTEFHSTGGREKINAAIKRSNQRANSIKAGLMYDSKLQQDDKKEISDNDMVLGSLPDLNFMLEDEPKTNINTHTNVDDIEVSENASYVWISLSKSSAAADSHVEEETSLHDKRSESDLISDYDSLNSMLMQKIMTIHEIRAARERADRDQLEYLQCIHDIIISLRNMSVKHLKTRKPLSQHTLRELKKTCILKDRQANQIWKTGYTKPRRIETWDDLLSASTIVKDPAPTCETQPVYVRSNHREVNCDRNLPIWIKLAMDKGDVFQNNRSNKTEDNKKVAEKARQDFNQIKQNVANEADNELSRLERERFMLFKVKLRCFEDSPTGDLLEDRRNIMERTATFITTCPDSEIPPSKWFEELKEKTISIVGRDDPRINDMLHKVGGYSAMAPKTVNYCKFVLTRILLGSAKQLVKWLMSRKLPYVIFPAVDKKMATVDVT